MPPINNGFWGEPTATIDWCEENYVYSYYIAEISECFNLFCIMYKIKMQWNSLGSFLHF